MKVGMIGLGVVGGTLKRWFDENTNHVIKLYDPPKSLHDEMHGCDAVFISVPVHSWAGGQDLGLMKESVERVKYSNAKVFIRSSVLPGTNDSFGTIAMPEFLTARRAYEDMSNLPLIFGDVEKSFVDEIFPKKEKIIVSNCEAEMAKFAHNCFGATKVTYFNIIEKLCEKHDCNYENVIKAAKITGFLGNEHMQVPGHDGMFGYGGSCFPVNMTAFEAHLKKAGPDFSKEADLVNSIIKLNSGYREKNVKLKLVSDDLTGG